MSPGTGCRLQQCPWYCTLYSSNPLLPRVPVEAAQAAALTLSTSSLPISLTRHRPSSGRLGSWFADFHSISLHCSSCSFQSALLSPVSLSGDWAGWHEHGFSYSGAQFYSFCSNESAASWECETWFYDHLLQNHSQFFFHRLTCELRLEAQRGGRPIDLWASPCSFHTGLPRNPMSPGLFALPCHLTEIIGSLYVTPMCCNLRTPQWSPLRQHGTHLVGLWVSVTDVQNLKNPALFCFVCCWFPFLSPDCPGAHCVVQTGLKQIPACLSLPPDGGTKEKRVLSCSAHVQKLTAAGHQVCSLLRLEAHSSTYAEFSFSPPSIWTETNGNWFTWALRAVTCSL